MGLIHEHRAFLNLRTKNSVKIQLPERNLTLCFNCVTTPAIDTDFIYFTVKFYFIESSLRFKESRLRFKESSFWKVLFHRIKFTFQRIKIYSIDSSCCKIVNDLHRNCQALTTGSYRWPWLQYSIDGSRNMMLLRP